jgi:hypothetical protein
VEGRLATIGVLLLPRKMTASVAISLVRVATFVMLAVNELAVLLTALCLPVYVASCIPRFVPADSVANVVVVNVNVVKDAVFHNISPSVVLPLLDAVALDSHVVFIDTVAFLPSNTNRTRGLENLMGESE